MSRSLCHISTRLFGLVFALDISFEIKRQDLLNCNVFESPRQRVNQHDRFSVMASTNYYWKVPARLKIITTPLVIGHHRRNLRSPTPWPTFAAKTLAVGPAPGMSHSASISRSSLRYVAVRLEVHCNFPLVKCPNIDWSQQPLRHS